MANPNTAVDLAKLHAAITQEIKAAFPTLKVVEFYREEHDRDPVDSASTPACLLELSELDPTGVDDPGTEQLTVTARFSARVIIGFRTPRAKLEIRRLAGALAVFLRNKRWGLTTDGVTERIPSGPATVVAIMPDEFSPELDRYEVWSVEWAQTLDLGESVWLDTGLSPDTPMYSWAPKIGFGNEHNYTPSLAQATAGAIDS